MRGRKSTNTAKHYNKDLLLSKNIGEGKTPRVEGMR